MKHIAFNNEYREQARKRAMIALLLIVLAVSSFYFFYMKPRRVVPILMYHGVSGGKNSTMFVTPANFERQMKFLYEEGYSVISLDELVDGIKEDVSFVPRTVVITFDDGYEDNFVSAFPVLARYGMPATIFVITGYMSGKEGYLNWDQVNLMSRNGIDFGGHTRNDVYLPSVDDPAVLWSEIAGSKEDIEKNTGKEARYFCYPTGGFNEKIKEIVKKAGYKGACTTNRGGRTGRDVYELSRVKVTNSDGIKPLHFRAKLSGYYNLFRREKKGY